MKLRVYADTSVLGGCEDKEFRTSSLRLMEVFIRGEMVLVLSDLTLRELETAPARVGRRVDALHIALATVARVDVLVSWNFKHIVNLTRIRAYNATNLRRGYPLLEIRSPQEVLGDE
jgi:hypothetical protein